MKERTILHSDVNNFFASVECANNENLKNKPVAVTGNPDKRTGIILAKNQLAKAYGVNTGEAIWQAKQKCPQLETIGPHYDLYQKVSKQLHNLYLEYTDFVEPLALDECWLDVTDSLAYLKKSGKQIADEIREKVKEKFGFTVSVGVSFSKIFAKLGSDLKKPDATTEIQYQTFKQQTYHLPLNSIVGIGPRLTKKFEKMNITKIGEFATLESSFVKRIMGKTGFELQQKLLGEFDERILNYYSQNPPKSIGNGTTTIVDIQTREDISKTVAFLSEKVSLRMANANFEGCCLTVSLKTNEFETFRHSCTYSPMRSGEEITKNAMILIDSFWSYTKQVRAIRIRMSSLQSLDKMEQLSMFGQDDDALNKTLKEVKTRYGNNKIFLASDTASFINRKNESEEHF